MSYRSTVLALGMAALLPLSAGASGVPEENGLQAVESFEQGSLYSAGPVRLVRLQGGYRQMGRQYGRLLRNELAELYRVAIEEEYIGRQGKDPAQMRTAAERYFSRYPKRYREVVEGMAETSGLGLEKHVLLNAVEWLNWLVRPGGHCSGLAVWGEYTGSGPLLFGRNNDDAAFVKLFAPYLVVVVLDPLDGSIPVAIVNYAGLVYAPNGLNAKGVFLELNSGNSMGYFPDRVSLCTTLLSFLQDYSTVEELEPAFKAVRADLSSIVAAADPAGAASFECSPVEAKRCAPEKPGVLAATNHFVDPSWGIPPPDDRTNGQTVTRRDHLLEQAEANKGHLTVARMKKLLETPIESGGALEKDGTIYQIIAEPESLTLWLRVPGTYDWQQLRLGRLLRPGGRGPSQR